MQSKTINPHVVEMLVCPLTKTRLSYNAAKTELISRAARMAFPIIKNIPMLCLEEARYLTEEELAQLND